MKIQEKEFGINIGEKIMKKEKMSLPQLKKLISEKYVQSSLTVVPFFQLREKYNAHHITDAEFAGVCKALHFELFGSGGFWANEKKKD